MNIGVIGFGHLGRALVSGLIKSGVNQNEILINAKSEKTVDLAKSMYPSIKVIENKEELVNRADVIVLVVEPKNAQIVLDEIKEFKISKKTIISFMAGIRVDDIRKMLHDEKEEYRIIRMMPNVAIAHCNGIIGLSSVYDDSELGDVFNVFHKLGEMIQMDEEQLESITITAASGLAFAAYLMKGYQNASQMLIGNKDISKRITLKVFENVIDMIEKEHVTFVELINQISTKGGTTEAGIEALEKSKIDKIINRCFSDAYQHIHRLKKS